MTSAFIYALIAIALFLMGFYALIVQPHLLRKILAINIMGSGVFLLLISLATRAEPASDPVPQAMVITGIVVAVSATALALGLMLRLLGAGGRAELPDDGMK